jgi:hypothetical protein
VFSDRFFGRWLQLEGAAQIVSLPEAMEGLVDYYRRISGEHPDWDDYRHAMEQQQRMLVASRSTRWVHSRRLASAWILASADTPDPGSRGARAPDRKSGGLC